MTILYNYKLKFLDNRDPIITSGGNSFSRNKQRRVYEQQKGEGLIKFLVDELGHNEDSICLSYQIFNDPSHTYVNKSLCWLQSENKLSDQEVFILRNMFPRLIEFKLLDH